MNQTSEQFEILGVKINATNLPFACREIEDWILSRKKSYVCVAPVATVVDCQRDFTYRRIVNNAGMTTPDGMPVVWLGRLKGRKLIERTYGPDLMLAFCDVSQRKGYRHYFYGGTEDANARLVDCLKRKFPSLNIAGRYSPPFRDFKSHETDEIITRINAAEPDVLWIGLGSPKQDYWMHFHRDRLNAPVMIGAGAAFDFISGTKSQAPVWMQRTGIEWFFRLCCEPRRLWRRYLVGNSLFIYLLLKDLLQPQQLKDDDTSQ